MPSGVPPGRKPGPDRDGPHVPVTALLLSVPVVLAVAVICIVARPGFLLSLLALGLTPIVVFAATLGAFMLRDRLRHHE
jgi:ABC-type dipeptide/oligopeptide/nickel transport system permease subunit